jgi:hypothetical protein
MIDKTKFVELLDCGYTNEQLAKYFDKGITTIKRFKSKNGFNGYKTNAKPLTEAQIAEVNTLAGSGYTLEGVCKSTGISDYRIKKYVSSTIYALLLSNGHKEFVKNLIKADITPVFSPTAKSAYICGVLQSDGYLTKDGYIGLTAKDSDFVEDFARFFKTGVRTVVIKNETYYSAKFKDVRNLEKFKEITGIYPNKTYTEYKIPTWISTNLEFFHEFIIGVFNGDGWAYKVSGRNACEVGIEQHRYNAGMLKQISNLLGWNHYISGDYCRISTKAYDVVDRFYEIYSQSENALLRKVQVLDQVYL